MVGRPRSSIDPISSAPTPARTAEAAALPLAADLSSLLWIVGCTGHCRSLQWMLAQEADVEPLALESAPCEGADMFGLPHGGLGWRVQRKLHSEVVSFLDHFSDWRNGGKGFAKPKRNRLQP